MSKIVLHDKEVAEMAISTYQLGSKPGDTLMRVAKYYAQVEQLPRGDVRRKLEDLLLKSDRQTVLSKWDDALSGIVKSAFKEQLIEIDGVPITVNELRVIDTLPSKRLARLAFTLLAVAKYWYVVKPKNNMWVNTTDKEIMKMANISASIKQQGYLLHELKELELIQFSKRVDNLNIQVLFADQEGPVAMVLTDYRNLGNQYMMHCGGSYFRCEYCGLTIKRKNNAHRYCDECAAELYIKKSVESVMRKRDCRASISERV